MSELPSDCRVTITLPLTSEELARELRMVQATQEILTQNGKQGNLRLSRIERLLGLEPEDSTPARSNLESLRGEIVQVLRDVAAYEKHVGTENFALLSSCASIADYNASNARALLEKLGEKV